MTTALASQVTSAGNGQGPGSQTREPRISRDLSCLTKRWLLLFLSEAGSDAGKGKEEAARGLQEPEGVCSQRVSSGLGECSTPFLFLIKMFLWAL